MGFNTFNKIGVQIGVSSQHCLSVDTRPLKERTREREEERARESKRERERARESKRERERARESERERERVCVREGKGSVGTHTRACTRAQERKRASERVVGRRRGR